MDDTPKPPLTYAALNPKTKLIEIIEMTTGKVIAVQKSTWDLVGNMRTAMVEHTLPDGGKILLERGIDPGAVVRSQYAYSQTTADVFCQRLAMGENITSICGSEGMPPYAVYVKWKRDYATFREQVEEARKDRAETLRDMAMKVAESADEDNVASSKLKHEAFKWGAGIDDQARYSPKAKVEATINTPMQLIVHTGIDRTIAGVNNEREVTNANENKAKDITAMPISAGSTTSPGPRNDGPERTVEVHRIPIADDE